MTSRAREVALELLRAVRTRDAYANLEMPALVRRAGLDARDAAFATELAYGTLRWRGWYDAVLASCVTRAWTDVEADLQDVLRLGAHQILRMRVPDHAAVAESADLARASGPPSAGRGRAGFVNAVLRSVASRDDDAWVRALAAGRRDDDIDWLATRWSHPVWIARALRDALGARRSELPALLEADNAAGRTTLVARRIPAAELRALPGTEPGRWSPYAARWAGGSPESLEVVRSGAVGVQDEGSQLMALALARAAVDGADGRWLDACAGPGGKAALLATLGRGRGARVTAVELHAHRAELVRSAAGADVDVVVGDATAHPWGDERFDRVLVDAPCTGLGVLGRRPESRWRRTPADVTVLADLQRALLRSALDATRPGGVVAYVTCSPHLAETDLVVDDVLRTRSDARQEDARALLPEVDDLGDGPAARLWPHLHGTDGMYLAVLRRT